MGFLDKLKSLGKKNNEAIDDGIDKAADVADDKTDGEYSDHIDTGAEKAKAALDGISEEE